MTTLILHVDLERLCRAMQPLSEEQKTPVLEALGFSPHTQPRPKAEEAKDPRTGEGA